MNSCLSCSKYTLLFVNLLVWVSGATLLGIGIYLRVEGSIESVVTVADIHIYYSGCYVLIASGLLMFIIGFLGCCGASTESRCLLGLYFAFLLLILLLVVGVGIWAYVEHDQIDDAVRKGFNQTISGGSDPNDAVAQSIITIQRQFHCCGLLNGCSDWVNSTTYGCGCKKEEKNCTLAASLGCSVGDKGGQYIYENDCYDAVVDYVEDNVWIMVGLGLGIGSFQIIAMTMAMILCCSLKKNDYEGIYA